MVEAALPSLRSAKVKEHTGCRLCGGTLYSFLKFGPQALPDFSQRAPNWSYAPLEICACEMCHLVQLRHSVDRDEVFRKYWYRSGISETMRAALKDIAAAAKNLFAQTPLSKEDVVLDIGSNDGTLLSHFPNAKTIGFDPSDIPSEYGDAIVKEYFTAAAYRDIVGQKARLIFSVGMLYSVDDPLTFIGDVADSLAPDGVWVVQMNDLASMIAYNSYDFIGHEHVCIYSLETLMALGLQHGLEVFYAERNMLNGGSLRVFLQHRKKTEADIRASVWHALRWEKGVLEGKQRFLGTLINFGVTTGERIMELRRLIESLCREGKLIHLKGASTRGSTIVQAAILDRPLIMKAADRDARKWGYLMPGTHIPIVSEQESRADKPDYYLVLIYSYMEQLKQREAEFLQRGGRFIVPLPAVRTEGL